MSSIAGRLVPARGVVACAAEKEVLDMETDAVTPVTAAMSVEAVVVMDLNIDEIPLVPATRVDATLTSRGGVCKIKQLRTPNALGSSCASFVPRGGMGDDAMAALSSISSVINEFNVIDVVNYVEAQRNSA